jgi:hypothetical protein
MGLNGEELTIDLPQISQITDFLTQIKHNAEPSTSGESNE